jgi:hypothetical protein
VEETGTGVGLGFTVSGCEYSGGFEEMTVEQSRFAAGAMAPVVIEPV